MRNNTKNGNDTKMYISEYTLEEERKKYRAIISSLLLALALAVCFILVALQFYVTVGEKATKRLPNIMDMNDKIIQLEEELEYYKDYAEYLEEMLEIE